MEGIRVYMEMVLLQFYKPRMGLAILRFLPTSLELVIYIG